jgi:hypothetical protein|tara:strand:- start:21504 stop:21674 length:171 start_codon:yes stop_codon:yes gene_type:complete
MADNIIEVEMEKFKEHKGSVRYNGAKGAYIQSIYIQKAALPDVYPERITVRVESDE